MSKPCNCGSGHPRYELRDAAGIFLKFVCTKCHIPTMAKFDPAIFNTNSPYAVSGDEQDIGRTREGDY